MVILGKNKSTGELVWGPKKAGLLSSAPPLAAGADPKSAMSLLQGSGPRVRKDGESPLAEEVKKDHENSLNETPDSLALASIVQTQNVQTQALQVLLEDRTKDKKDKKKKKQRSVFEADSGSSDSDDEN